MAIKSRAKTGRTEQLNIRVSPELKEAILEISKRDAPEGRIQKPIGEILDEAIFLYELANTRRPLTHSQKYLGRIASMSLAIRMYKYIPQIWKRQFFDNLKYDGDPIAQDYLGVHRFRRVAQKNKD